MPTIAAVRPVLLSAPYADPENGEVRAHLPTGWRTTGLVEITLDDGSVGLGEAYLAVFAPRVFVEIVALLGPHLVGEDAADVAARHRDACDVTAYWSLTGAARHVVGAVETALWDARGVHLGTPVHGTRVRWPHRSVAEAAVPALRAAARDAVPELFTDFTHPVHTSHRARPL